MINEFKQILSLLFPFWKKYWKNEIMIVIMLISSFLVSIYIPLKFQEVIDSLVNYETNSSFITVLLVMAMLVILRIVISWFYAVYITQVGESFIIDVTSAVYLAVLKKQRSFWISFSPNDVLTRLTQDIVSVKSFLFDFLHNSFFQGMIILGILSVLFFLNLSAGIIVSILTVIAFISSYFGSDYLNKKAFTIRQIASRFTHIFQTGISYPALNFSWNLFSNHIGKYKINAKEMRQEQVAFVNQMQLINQGIAVINLIIGTVVLFLILRSDLYSGLITIGGMFSIIMYSNGVIQATTGLASNIVSTKLNRVSVLRITEMQENLSYNKAYYEPKERIEHPFFKNEFQDGFILPNKDKYLIILNSSNGSGKSTLAQTLTGFDDLADKIWKEVWFLLPSEPIILENTLYDNIKLISGRDVTHEQIKYILSVDNLGALLSIFPEGLETEVLANSEKISRGQKQVLGLIAAIVKDPAAIIIDEGLNSLDNAIKLQIKYPLLKWLKLRKAILIDHEKLYTDQDVNTEIEEELPNVIG